jgi:outer membrane protein assembly factor BamB
MMSRIRGRRRGRLVRAGGLAPLGVAALAVASQAVASGDWATIGHDPADSWNQPFEHQISPAKVSRLAPKWVATTTSDVSSMPAVVHGAVYFGDFGGAQWKLDAETGAVIWSHQVSEHTRIAGDDARTSPPDQVLRRGRSTVSSTAGTVTDAAGNVSAPSNGVTMQPVRGDGR